MPYRFSAVRHSQGGYRTYLSWGGMDITTLTFPAPPILEVKYIIMGLSPISARVFSRPEWERIPLITRLTSITSHIAYCYSPYGDWEYQGVNARIESSFPEPLYTLAQMDGDTVPVPRRWEPESNVHINYTLRQRSANVRPERGEGNTYIPSRSRFGYDEYQRLRAVLQRTSSLSRRQEAIPLPRLEEE